MNRSVLIFVVVAAALVGIFVVWQRSRDRESGAVEALVADVDKLCDDIDKALAESGDDVTRDLERFGAINKRADKLTLRVGEIAPQIDDYHREQFHDPLAKLIAKRDLMGKRFAEMQEQMGALKAKQK
jgi:uncharacterized coiled-coil DUF342 family protein